MIWIVASVLYFIIGYLFYIFVHDGAFANKNDPSIFWLMAVLLWPLIMIGDILDWIHTYK